MKTKQEFINLKQAYTRKLELPSNEETYIVQSGAVTVGRSKNGFRLENVNFPCEFTKNEAIEVAKRLRNPQIFNTESWYQFRLDAINTIIENYETLFLRTNFIL